MVFGWSQKMVDSSDISWIILWVSSMWVVTQSSSGALLTYIYVESYIGWASLNLLLLDNSIICYLSKTTLGGVPSPSPPLECLSLLVPLATLESFLLWLDDKLGKDWGVKYGGEFVGFLPLSLFFTLEVTSVSSTTGSIG